MVEERDIFLTLKDDYREALEHLNDALLRLENNPQDHDSLKDAGRQLHNVKGFANRMRAPKLGQLAHLLEEVLASIKQDRIPLDDAVANLLFQAIDIFVHYLRTREVPTETVAPLVEEVEAKLFSVMEEEAAEQDLEALLPDFVAAARDNVEAINQGLYALEKEPSNDDTLREVYRNAHSLKGSALTMGFERMGRLAHRMEDLFRAFQTGHVRVTPDACDALFEANDAISVMLDTTAAGKRMRVNVEISMARMDDFLVETTSDDSSDLEPEAPPPEPEASTPPVTQPIDTVRVSTSKLDELVNLAGEAVIAQIRLANELGVLANICDSWQRLRLRAIDSFHPAAAESQGDMTLLHRLMELGDHMEQTSLRLQESAEYAGRCTESLQHKSMEIRMLPLALVFDTLPRAVRDLSRQFNKQLDFQVEGAQTTIDKRILEQLGDPLIHLLRNALDHGIESPEVRRQSGKPETATIRLRASQEGDKVILTLEDDGKGIDPRQLKEVAISKGFIKESEVTGWSEVQLLDLIFIPGLSTSALVTDISGRGMGTDVVRANVERLKGQVQVSSDLNKGTRFVISLPLTLATVHALMVCCAGEILAIPTLSVLEIVQAPTDEIKFSQGQRVIMLRGEVVPVRNLARTLGWQERNGEMLVRGRAMFVVLHSGERKAAFLVEELLGEQEIVTKDLGSHLQKVKFVAGATILGSGTVALILDVPQLFLQEQSDVSHEWSHWPTEDRSIQSSQVILVVDDQAMTRQMEQSILEAAGYQVITAENGADALDKLEQLSCDLVVTDLHMPKMDGFTLTKEIRDKERIRDLPIVIVAPTERQEDKRRGLEVGADAYLVKSSFDQREMIETIQTLLEQETHQGQ
ncbi:MAG: Hpt domain-containing protein [Deltaproteobacteria bacterium]|nr:MAG: Hpt domain-containing protein [Deltaproteobacteria bacterium]